MENTCSYLQSLKYICCYEPLHVMMRNLYRPLAWLGSVVGIATGYGLDGPEIESQWGGGYSAPVQTGPTQPPAQWVPGLSRGSRAAGA